MILKGLFIFSMIFVVACEWKGKDCPVDEAIGTIAEYNIGYKMIINYKMIFTELKLFLCNFGIFFIAPCIVIAIAKSKGNLLLLLFTTR